MFGWYGVNIWFIKIILRDTVSMKNIVILLSFDLLLTLSITLMTFTTNYKRFSYGSILILHIVIVYFANHKDIEKKH